MSKFASNSTMIPNAFIDEVMGQLSDKAVRLYLVIVRKTTGWRKEWDSISISQFKKITGIKDDRTIRSGVQELVKFGLVESISSIGQPTKYGLIKSLPPTSDVRGEEGNNGEQPLASNVPPANNVPPTSDVPYPLHLMQQPPTSDVPDPLHEMHPTKETNTKETNTKETKQKKVLDLSKLESSRLLTQQELFDLCPNDLREDLWVDFVKLRKRKNAERTVKATRALFKKLDECVEHGVSKNEMVDLCLDSGWKGVNVSWYFNNKNLPATGTHGSATRKLVRTPTRIHRDNNAIEGECQVVNS